MKIDLSKPDGGRMVDYWLGGHHNFLIDRQVAHHERPVFGMEGLESRG